jgi:hypothetical protein
MIKAILKYFNDNAQVLYEISLGTYREPDYRMVCRHCGQYVNDPSINHAKSGCTFKVKRD